MYKQLSKALIFLLGIIPVITYSQITTQQPLVLTNSQDTICSGSVMDIPFISTGGYSGNNTYIAQLSDSTGSFTNANVLGTLATSQAFTTGGIISGIIVPANQPIPAGCNYYIRVISTHPAKTGSTYGPFCIRHCDIETNNNMDLHFCISASTGIDTSLHVTINVFDSSAVYPPADTFQVQVLSSYTFNVLNTGALGYLVAGTTDTVLHLVIPGVDSLRSFRMATGEYYLRVIATNSNEPWNTSGTLIRLTIGAPQDPILVWLLDGDGITGHSVPDTSVCLGGTLYYGAFPYNFQSTFQWTLDGDNQWPDYGGFTSIDFLDTGVYHLSVIETNNGCVGLPSDTVVITVNPLPVANFALSADSNQLHHYSIINSSSGNEPLSYYWSWGDSTHDTIAYPMHIYNVPGFYDICLSVTDLNGCTSVYCNTSLQGLDTANAMIYINVIPAGINELNAQTREINIYPNPVTDELYINTGGLYGSKILTIYNILGESIYTKETNRKQETVNCKPFSAGIYFLQMKSESGSVVKRFVKD